TNNDTGAFGATQNALVVNSVEGTIRNVLVWGGAAAINCTNTDNNFDNINASEAYGTAIINTSGADWYRRCKIDHGATGIAVTNAEPFPAWAANTAYTVGQLVSRSGYLIQCAVAGTSGATGPTLKNYGVAIPDGTGALSWLLTAPVTYAGISLNAGSGENHFEQCDFS